MSAGEQGRDAREDEPPRRNEQNYARFIEVTPNPHPPSERVRAAVEAGLGLAQADEWSVADFNADKNAEIERENR